MKVAVLGGGISGMSASWYLAKQGHEVSLFEQKERLGGWLSTSLEGNSLFEEGPRTFQVSRSSHLLELIKELGLENELIFSHPSAKKRYLYFKGRLRPFPSNPFSLLTSAITRDLLFSLLLEPFRKKGEKQDESIGEFARRRLGEKSGARLFDPLVKGIYSGDIEKLSIRSCFPSLFLLEKKAGSLVKGFLKKKKSSSSSALFSLEEGMSSLVRSFEKKFSGDIHLNTEITSVDFSQTEIETTKGVFSFDHLVCALPAQQTGQLLGKEFSYLALMETASVVVVHLGYREDLLPLKGFGYLVPSSEKESILGMVWDSSIFPEQNRSCQTRVTVLLGGVFHPEMIKASEEECKRLALEAMEKHIGIKALPSHAKVIYAKDAIAQMHVGHHEKIEEIEKIVENYPLTLVGSYLRGASVDKCIENSSKLELG